MPIDVIPDTLIDREVQFPTKRHPDNGPGYFLSIEGIDGAGKTTVVAAIVAELQKWGIPVSVHREPGGTAAGEAIREIFKDASCPLTPTAQCMMIFTSREQLLHEEILPALARGEVVICDRYVDTTFAMQYCADGADTGTFIKLADNALLQATPDTTVYLDIPIEVSRERQGKRGLDVAGDRYESRDDDYHNAIREAYRSLHTHYGDDLFTLVDASVTQEAVVKDVLRIVNKRIIKPRIGKPFSGPWWLHHSLYYLT